MKSPSAKSEIRREVISRRDALPPAGKALKDRAIKERLLSMPEFKNARRCVLFASFRSEVDTFPIIGAALSAGKRVFLPRVEGDALSLYEIGSPGELKPGCMGIPEPAAGGKKTLPGKTIKILNEADIIVVPGAAFDTGGGRLGYGRGFYDRLLSGLAGGRAPFVALAYELQVRTSPLPALPHDVKMDFIVTEERVIACGRG